MSKLQSLPSAFNVSLEHFAKHCLRYGSVTGYDDYIDHNNKECRVVSVIVQGCNAVITKRTGEVISAEFSPI